MENMLQNLPRDTFERMETAAPELVKLPEELSETKDIARIRKLLQKRKLLPDLAAAWLIPMALIMGNFFV